MGTYTRDAAYRMYLDGESKKSIKKQKVLDEVPQIDPGRHHRQAIDEMATVQGDRPDQKLMGELAQMGAWREQAHAPILDAMRNRPMPQPEAPPEEPYGAPTKEKFKLGAVPNHHGWEGLHAGTQQWALQTLGMFPGLQFTSGYRDPAHNKAAGGVKGSLHTQGMAFDAVGPQSQMEAAAAWLNANGPPGTDAFVHANGSGNGGVHLHVEFEGGHAH